MLIACQATRRGFYSLLAAFGPDRPSPSTGSAAAFFFLLPGGCGGGSCGSTVSSLFSRM
ncbi:MAG: hypothetical protein AW07_00919 [Candidatus Accumulibacter sp. SK-11]|nr:MAG: hypothetical protein AW07_00919 [Candidatus Accumulibacter sp. SK-11]